jgi:hypothetical protein
VARAARTCHRRVVLAAVAALLVAHETYARAAGANIRVDLLVTIPLVSIAAAALGIAVFRQSRLAGATLLICGAPALAWFSYRMAVSSIESSRITGVFYRARKLYWDETIRCARNFNLRFGPLPASSDPCLGNLAVKSRSEGSYPYSRVVVNELGDAFLLYTAENGVEVNVQLDDRPAVRLSGDSGTGTLNTEPVRVDLRASGDTCQAEVIRGGRRSLLTLAKPEPPACEEPPDPPVRFLGAWGNPAAQVWLWETDREARGLYIAGIRPQGLMFVKRVLGRRVSGNTWNLGEFTLTIAGGAARASGAPFGDVTLENRETVSDPRISLTPVYDRARFEEYFDNVFDNLILIPR